MPSSFAFFQSQALLIFSDGPNDRIDVLKTTVDGLRGQGIQIIKKIFAFYYCTIIFGYLQDRFQGKKVF